LSIFHIFTVSKAVFMPQAAVINIANVTKSYGPVPGVKDISFQVYEGEIFGFLGPNGAGKTTTIRLLLDLLRSDAGRIEVFGRDLARHSLEIRRRCGYLPGSFSAYGNLTGLEFLHFCADLRDIPRKIDASLLERFGLVNNNLTRKIKYLSHGTLQKLGIVQACFHGPELLILDEPTIGLDPLMQEEFYKLLHEHREKGATIFLSSHNLAEVERICHRVAIIRKAEIEKVDSIENLRKMLRKKLRVVLSEPAGDMELPGAEMTGSLEMTYEYIIHGEIGPVLKRLSELPLAEVTLPEPGLEEIFIHFYKDRDNG
jgi:ABC-2 type transport system ATP-binding protein